MRVCVCVAGVCMCVRVCGLCVCVWGGACVRACVRARVCVCSSFVFRFLLFCFFSLFFPSSSHVTLRKPKYSLSSL